MSVESLRKYIQQRSTHRMLYVVGLATLLLAPLVSGRYYTGVLTEAIIFGLLAVSIDLALGYAGLLTLAPAAFFGIGAYSVAKGMVTYGQSFWLGLVLALIVAALFSVVVAYVPIKQRMRGVYFALFTMAFGVVAYDFTYTTTSFTGGSNGLGYVSPPTVAGINLSGTIPYYYFSLFVTVLTIAGVTAVLRSDYGLILNAIRQNEQRMEYLGYNTDRETLLAWVGSCLISSLSGALYVGLIGIAAPTMMSFHLTGETLVWVVVGGLGSLIGPFLAGFGLTVLESALSSVWAESYLLLLGILFVTFVFLFPSGIVGFFKD